MSVEQKLTAMAESQQAVQAAGKADAFYAPKYSSAEPKGWTVT